MNTDQMILDLVGDGGWSSHGKGFTLPKGLHWISGGKGYWSLGREIEDLPHYIESQHAHDLCAMEFARQAVGHPNDNVAWQHHLRHLLIGDSAAAIAALWEATK